MSRGLFRTLIDAGSKLCRPGLVVIPVLMFMFTCVSLFSINPELEDVRSNPVSLEDVRSSPVPRDDVMSNPASPEDVRSNPASPEDVRSNPVPSEDVRSNPVPPEDVRSALPEASAKHQLLLSMHVRKAGGSTLRVIFDGGERALDSWKGHHVLFKNVHPVEGHLSAVSSYKLNEGIGCTFPDIDRLKETGELYDLDVLHGFFPWDTVRSFPADINVETAIVFRDPTERVISAYFYEQRTMADRVTYASKGLTLMEYAKAELRHQGYYMRLMCRCDCNPPSYTQADIELVKRRIDTIDFLGIMSQMKDFVVRLNGRIPWLNEDPSKHEICTKNCGPTHSYRQEYPEVAKILDEGLVYDWEVYRYVEEVVRKRSRLLE